MSLKKYINEEISKFINEGRVFDDNNFAFNDNVKKCQFDGYSSFNEEHGIEIGTYNILAKWKVGFWLNDNGIENFTINIEGVEGEYVVNFLDKTSDEVIKTADHNISETNWEYLVENTAELKLNQSLYVDSIVFNFTNKQCIVKFI